MAEPVTTDEFGDTAVIVPYANGSPGAFRLICTLNQQPGTLWLHRGGVATHVTFQELREALDALEAGPVFDFPKKQAAVIAFTGDSGRDYYYTRSPDGKWVSSIDGKRLEESDLIGSAYMWRVIFEGVDNG